VSVLEEIFATQKEPHTQQAGKVLPIGGIANVSDCSRQRLPTTDSVMAIPLLACCRDTLQSSS
jgi:hypothetical protein